jgi:RNA polymerase sigma-70 factor, ECF subfamily
LNRTVVNLVIDRSRRHREEISLASVEGLWHDDDYTVDPARVLALAEERDALEDALARLPALYRLPVVLHDGGAWTAKEIADAVGAGLPAVKQRLRRGRMMLVSALDEESPKRRASLAQPMHCWRARRHISGYLDGELQPETAAAVEEHLAGCPTCPPLYASLVGIRASLGGLRDPDAVIPDQIAARVAAALSRAR